MPKLIITPRRPAVLADFPATLDVLVRVQAPDMPAGAQPQRGLPPHRIGWISTETEPDPFVDGFREGLRRSPRNGRMLFGLMKSLDAEAKREAADSVRREFEREWRRADVALRIEDL